MSRETSKWLNTNTLIGFTEKRGEAWHYRAEDQGEESNHYAGAIPVGDVERRLFNWRGEERELFYASAFGPMPVEGRKAIVRSDTEHVMGIFADGYRPHQYSEWLIGAVSNILGDSLSIGSAGLLKGGAVAWVQVEVADSVTTPEGVVFRPNLLACTSFDGSLATTYKRTVTIVVCDNTKAVALREDGEKFKVKHTAKSLSRLSDARQALGIVEQTADAFGAEVAALCATTVTDRQWSKFLDLWAPIPDESGRARTMAENKRGEISRLWKHDARVTDWRGTAWGVVQAVNTYAHHIAPVRNASRGERNMLNAATGKTETTDREAANMLASVLA